MMHCQKCRAPLKLHSTIETLNPASFQLLVDSTPPPTGPTPLTRPPYTPEQRKRYDEAIRDTTTSQASSAGHSAPPSTPTRRSSNTKPPSPTATRADANMSFINVTSSQIVPPSVAAAQNQQTPTRKGRSWTRRTSTPASSSPTPTKPLTPSQKMERSMRLFEILSSRTDVDHPVCLECTEELISGMEKRLAATLKERDAYVDFLRSLAADSATDQEVAAGKSELEQVRKEEEEKLHELEELEAEKARLEREMRELDEESKELDKEEEVFWAERNAVEAEARALKEEEESLELKIKHDEQLLRDLERVNVWDDAFHISHDGPFGTINGLRLGSTSSTSVEWSEINAAWGMTCLLLSTMAERLKCEFKGYRLNPLGSTSSVDEIKVVPTSGKSSLATSTTSNTSDPAKHQKTNTTSYPLHYASDLPISLPWSRRSFSDAMVAFCECVRQLGSHVAKITRDRTGIAKQLSYVIEKDKLWFRAGEKGDLSTIRLSNNWDEWTKACKRLLVNCKELLVVAKDEDARGETG